MILLDSTKWNAKKSIELSPIEYALLQALASNEEVYYKDILWYIYQLTSRLLDYQALKMHISRLRRKGFDIKHIGFSRYQIKESIWVK